MRIHSYGMEGTPAIIMLPGSFCNADTMADRVLELLADSKRAEQFGKNAYDFAIGYCFTSVKKELEDIYFGA